MTIRAQYFKGLFFTETQVSKGVFINYLLEHTSNRNNTINTRGLNWGNQNFQQLLP